MLALIRVILAALVGLLLGLAFTVGALDRSALGVAVGPWRAIPRQDNGEADPYALAAIARSSLLPLGAAEGLAFVASTASDGTGLASRCDFAVTGPTPSARAWTISLLDPSGYPVPDPVARYGFTSAEMLREAGSSFVIEVSPAARTGNWLPTGKATRYVLMLRLYDSGLTAVGTVLGAAAMPSIKTIRCR